MPTLAPPVEVASINATNVAAANWESNLAALRLVQPTVAEILSAIQFDPDWIFARDGSLTCLTPGGHWWADCSVPLLASRALLKSLEQGPVSSCLLDPPNAGMVRAARERMGEWAVLFVIQPQLELMRMILSCHDFSEQILHHRIWFACGNTWDFQLRKILIDHSGLITPSRFIRTRLSSDEVITPLIAEAQSIFSCILSERAELIVSLKSQAKKRAEPLRILHIGGGEFRLWDFGAQIIGKQLLGSNVQRFDTDHALSGSPIALLEAVQGCGLVVAADLCRVDGNQLVTDDVPWITWITQGHVPLFENAGPQDGLILADSAWQSLAQKAGWPAERIRTCSWPIFRDYDASTGAQPVLGLICDTHPIHVPTNVKDFSSHRLLWDLIEEELAANPLAVADIDAYLADRAQQLNIKIEALDQRAFVANLILPAYQQGLARLLINNGLPLIIFGKGWEDIPEFKKKIGGEINNPVQFSNAISQCSGLVYCWPKRSAHPIDSIGKPIVHRSGRDTAQLIRNARLALSGVSPTPPSISNSKLSLRNAIGELIENSTVEGGNEIPNHG